MLKAQEMWVSDLPLARQQCCLALEGALCMEDLKSR